MVVLVVVGVTSGVHHVRSWAWLSFPPSFLADSASASGFDSNWNSDMDGEEKQVEEKEEGIGKKTRKRKKWTGFSSKDDRTTILEGKRRRTSNPAIHGEG